MRTPLLTLPFIGLSSLAMITSAAGADPIIGAASTSCADHTMLRATKIYELNREAADAGLMHAFRAFMSGYNTAAKARNAPMIDLARLEEDPLGARQTIALDKINQTCTNHPDKVMSEIFLMVIAELNAAD